MVIIENTEHAGVGSVLDHSNAEVAKLLGVEVIPDFFRRIGRLIDEIILNKSLFKEMDTKLIGV